MSGASARPDVDARGPSSSGPSFPGPSRSPSTGFSDRPPRSASPAGLSVRNRDIVRVVMPYGTCVCV